MGVAIHKDRPVGEAEVFACGRELSKEQLCKLIVGPKVGGRVLLGPACTLLAVLLCLALLCLDQIVGLSWQPYPR